MAIWVRRYLELLRVRDKMLSRAQGLSAKGKINGP
jgi:hypothetical protein